MYPSIKLWTTQDTRLSTCGKRGSPSRGLVVWPDVQRQQGPSLSHHYHTGTPRFSPGFFPTVQIRSKLAASHNQQKGWRGLRVTLDTALVVFSYFLRDGLHQQHVSCKSTIRSSELQSATTVLAALQVLTLLFLPL